jgi:dynein heavy chain, axonemal
VLRTAGASKRTSPDKSEMYLMMRTLRDMNMSKFVAEDVPLFLSLIEDLFPGLKAERAQFADVSAALDRVVASKNLQPHPTWLNKNIQLYETYLVRHGIMVIGPTGSGKTAIVESLSAAMTEMGTKHVLWKMNPKAITAPQMFGMLDASTGDWTDGVFAVLWRRAAKAKNQNTLIVLDGPVGTFFYFFVVFFEPFDLRSLPRPGNLFASLGVLVPAYLCRLPPSPPSLTSHFATSFFFFFFFLLSPFFCNSITHQE